MPATHTLKHTRSIRSERVSDPIFFAREALERGWPRGHVPDSGPYRNTIKSMAKELSSSTAPSRMIALFGPWGSGKTTLLLRHFPLLKI